MVYYFVFVLQQSGFVLIEIVKFGVQFVEWQGNNFNFFDFQWFVFLFVDGVNVEDCVVGVKVGYGFYFYYCFFCLLGDFVDIDIVCFFYYFIKDVEIEVFFFCFNFCFYCFYGWVFGDYVVIFWYGVGEIFCVDFMCQVDDVFFIV